MLGSFAFRAVDVDPKFLQREDALLDKPSVRHPCASAERAGESPVTFAASPPPARVSDSKGVSCRRPFGQNRQARYATHLSTFLRDSFARRRLRSRRAGTPSRSCSVTAMSARRGFTPMC